MAEQQKESSSVDPKDGSSSLDDGIGKEFLSSWKSISMADDDPLDFSFDSVSKGKNKTFNFDKLDMDFNLDGELDKISSFKVDMSDLDFSCSPKKSTKSKESKGGKSSGAKEQKRDSFDFNFDFNELDTFNLDSSLKKGDRTSTTKLNKKVVSDVCDLEGDKEPKPNDDEHVHASNDNMALKPLATEAVDTSKVEIREDNERDLGSKQEGSVSKVSSSGKPDMLIEARTTLGINKTLRPVEKDLERELFLKTTSSKSNSQDINNPPQSFELNCSNQDTLSDQHAEAHSPGTKVTAASENSSPLQINKLGRTDKEATEFGSCTQAEATNDLQPVKSFASFEKTTKTDLLNKTSHDKDIKEKQSSTLDGHLATTSSEPIVDKVVLIKDKEIEGVQSKFFCKPGDSVHLKHNLLTAGTNDVSFGCKEIGNMQLGPITKARESFKSNDSECGTKLINDSTPASSEPMRDELVLHGGKDDVKISSNA